MNLIRFVFIPTKIEIYGRTPKTIFYFVWGGGVPNALWRASIQALHLGALRKPTCDTINDQII